MGASYKGGDNIMLIVIAEKEELKLVEELGYSNYPVLITGCGGVNVINALKDLPRDTEILNIGYCGSKHFNVGDKINVIGVSTLHTKADLYDYLLLDSFNTLPFKYKDADCFTSTDFVTDSNIEIPCVFDMELAFIRAMFDNVSAIKVVSDNLNKEEYKENLKN